MQYRIKHDGELYELTRLTLGHARLLKHEFGIEDMSEVDESDPDMIAGVLTIMVMDKNPEMTLKEAVAMVDAFDLEAFEAIDEKEETVPPTEAAEVKGNGSSATRRKTSGART